MGKAGEARSEGQASAGSLATAAAVEVGSGGEDNGGKVREMGGKIVGREEEAKEDPKRVLLSSIVPGNPRSWL